MAVVKGLVCFFVKFDDLSCGKFATSSCYKSTTHIFEKYLARSKSIVEPGNLGMGDPQSSESAYCLIGFGTVIGMGWGSFFRTLFTGLWGRANSW